MRLLLAALALFFSAAVGAAPVSPFNGGLGKANDNASTIQINGAFPSIWTLSAPTSIIWPTSGTLLSTANPINVGANPITGGPGSFTSLSATGPLAIATGGGSALATWNTLAGAGSSLGVGFGSIMIGPNLAPTTNGSNIPTINANSGGFTSSSAIVLTPDTNNGRLIQFWTGTGAPGTALTNVGSFTNAGLNITPGVDTVGVSPFTISKTWNNAAVAFPGVTYSFVDTASAATSTLFNISAGSAGVTPRFVIGRRGNVGFHTLPSTAFAVLSQPSFGITTGANQTGAVFIGMADSTGTGVNIGVTARVDLDTAASTTAIAFSAGNPILSTGATVQNNYGLFVNDLTVASSVNAAVRSEISAGVNKYNFYGSGSAQSRFNGPLLLPGLATSAAATTGTLCWTTGTGNVTVNATLACLSSSERYKQNIRDLDAGLPQVMALRPVSYELKPEYDGLHLGRMVGLVAEEVAKVDPRLVQFGDDGNVEGVRYMQASALLVRAIQEQQFQIVSLTERINRLESLLANRIAATEQQQ